MVELCKFRPVKHLQVFEQMYETALDGLKTTLGSSFDRNLTAYEVYKRNCEFNKDICIYYKGEKIIGFCMYQIIDHAACVIFDFVDDKFKGCGRSARYQLIDYLKDINKDICEIFFCVHKENYLSINSVRKVVNERGDIYMAEESHPLSDKIEFKLILL